MMLLAEFEKLLSRPLPMLIGFFIAVIVVSFACFINWRHYIRYWVRSDPPYPRRKVSIMRGFFLACVLGSMAQLGLEIAQNRPSFNDLSVSLFDAFLILAIFFLLDSFFRWQMGPPKNTGS
jgi:hypothetical protein